MPLADYHEFQIKCALKDATDSISFSEFENDLGDSYYSSVLFGSENGNRRWNITMPTLQGGSLSPQAVGPSGSSLPYAQYLSELFWYNKTTGRPFAYKCPRTQQYYLARFADRGLSMQRMLTKLYSTGVEIKQVRVPGDSVFTPNVYDEVWEHYDPEDYTGTNPTAWIGTTDNGNTLATKTGSVVGLSNIKNGLKVVRFNATANDGFISSTLGVTIYDLFMVLKIREATFSNNGGVLTSDVTGAALVGDTGTTKFYYFAENMPFTYSLNGTAYDATNMQAPMNTHGVVHVRFEDGLAITNLQIGKDRDYAGRFAEMEMGDLIITTAPLPLNIVSEFEEHLAAKWAIGS